MKKNTMALTYRNRVVLIATLMVSIICAPLQAWNIQMPSWLVTHGPAIGLAALGAVSSYGVYAFVHHQIKHQKQPATPEHYADPKNRISWIEAKKAFEKQEELEIALKQKEEEYDKLPMSYSERLSWQIDNLDPLIAEYNYQLWRQDDYRKQTMPKACGNAWITEKNNAHLIANKSKAMRTAALRSLGLLCTTGLLACAIKEGRYSEYVLPFFGAAGVAAFFNWVLQSSKHKADLKKQDETLDQIDAKYTPSFSKYISEAPDRQNKFEKAIFDDDIQTAKDLLENHDVEVNNFMKITFKSQQMGQTIEEHLTPLMLAVRKKNISLVKLLLVQPTIHLAAIDAQTGHSALIIAIEQGDKELVDLLLPLQNKLVKEKDDLLLSLKSLSTDYQPRPSRLAYVTPLVQDASTHTAKPKDLLQCAIDNKQYHLLQIFDLSDSRLQSRNIFAEIIERLDTCRDKEMSEELSKLTQDPLFMEMIGNDVKLGQIVSSLLECHDNQGACNQFMSNRLGWGRAAGRIFTAVLQQRKKISQRPAQDMQAMD